MHHLVTFSLAILVFFSDVVQNRGEGTLVPLISIVDTFIELELASIFAVDAVIGQVHKHIVQVLLARSPVRLSWKSGHALLKEVDSKRVNW